MTVENILNAIGSINDEAVQDARTYKRNRFSQAAKWGAIAACFGVIFTVTMLTLPGVLRNQGNIVPPPGPDVPAPVVSDDDNQPDVEPLQPSGGQKLIINWDNVAVNESAGMMAALKRRYIDLDLYDIEKWGEQEIVAYYGWNLTPNYIPDGLTDGGKALTGFIHREKATDEIAEEYVSRGFWVDFWEDGSPKSNDDLYIPTGFTIRAARLGIPHDCCLLPVDEARTTDFGGVSVTLSHCSLPHGPYDPTQKAPDGLYNMPAGYYDIYTASFTLDGVEYEIEAHRLELEEVVKITASVISGPSDEDFIVGNS